METMFNEIGKKIKTLAKVIFVLVVISALIMGVVLIATLIKTDKENLAFIGFLVMIVGSVIAWLLSCLLYGFGELIDKTCDIERNTRGEKTKSNIQKKDDSERERKLEKLLSQGMITEEEYHQAMNK